MLYSPTVKHSEAKQHGFSLVLEQGDYPVQVLITAGTESSGYFCCRRLSGNYIY